MKNKKSVATLALLCLLITHIPTLANETALIGCFTEIASYPNLLETWGIQIENGCYADILEEIRAQLQEYDISVTTSTNREDWDSAILVMDSPLDIHGTPLVSLESLQPEHLALSPILAAHATEEIVAYALSLPNRSAIADLMTALILYSSGECDGAITYFDLVSKSSIIEDSFMTGSGSFNPPLLDYIQFYKGNCALIEGEYEIAIKHFESFSSEDLFWGTVNAPTNLAWTYFQIGEQDRAFEIMNQTIQGVSSGWNAYPRKQVAAYQSRAQLYALAYRFDDAIADLNAALDLDPNNPELYVLRGQMYLYLYEWDSSLADYNHAIELDPTYADAYYYRGVLYYSILQTGVELRAEAVADFQHYLELAPDGDHAADAARYIEQIETELAALNE